MAWTPFRYEYRGYWLINCKGRVDCRAKDESSVKLPDWAGNTPAPALVAWPVEGDREGAQRLVDAVCSGNHVLLKEWASTWTDKYLGVQVFAGVLAQVAHGQGLLPGIDLTDTPPPATIEPVAVRLAAQHPLRKWIMPGGLRCSLTYRIWHDGTESYRLLIQDANRRPLTQLALSADMASCTIVEDHPGRYWAQNLDRRPVARLIKGFRQATISPLWYPDPASPPSTPLPKRQGFSSSGKSRF